MRWVQFGCFTPLMQAHGRFEQEAWTYDDETLELYRALRAAARAAGAVRARGGGDRGALRAADRPPAALTDPGDARGWAIADAYGYGPSLWVAPVLEAGAREREVDLPRGDWIDYWTGEELAGGGEVVAPRRSGASRCGCGAAR